MSSRFFGHRQRNAAYRSTEGRCAACGAELEDGWHMDHVTPWSIGGKTKSSNGQPLCPACNLQKGNRVEYSDAFVPRKCQREIITAALARIAAGETHTVVEVAPGSGKTLAYQSLLTQMMRPQGGRAPLIEYGAIYTPRLVLSRQAEISYRHDVKGQAEDEGDYALFDARCRLEKIVHRRNIEPLLKSSWKRYAFVTTYQSGTTDPKLHLDWAEDHQGKFALILDEAQFCGAEGDSEGGGTAAGGFVRQMAAFARHTILLTGTPKRADGKPLAIAEYTNPADDPTGKGRRYLKTHARATYADGVAQQYLREFEAAMHKGNVSVRDKLTNELTEYEISTPKAKKDRAALADILREPDVWQPIVDKTVQRLRVAQKANPNYRALVACIRKDEARDVADYLRVHYPNLRVEVSLSDDGLGESERALRDFKAQPRDVLVTVRKAFIGYDCPQITVVAVLTNYRDKGHLLQLVGRGMRVWNPKDSGQPARFQRCHIITLDDPAMQQFIDYLRVQQDEGLAQRGDDLDGHGDDDSPGESRKVLEHAEVTSIAVESNTGSVDEDDAQLYDGVLDELGPIDSPDKVQRLLDLLQVKAVRVDTPVTEQESLFTTHPRPAGTPKTDQELIEDCKGDAAREIGQHMRRLGDQPSDRGYGDKRARITNQINRSFGIDKTEEITTLDHARRYLAHVRRWAIEARSA